MRKLLTLTLLLPCLSLAAEAPSYAGAADCRIVNNQPKEYQRGTWSGPCADGYASGNGVLQWYRDDQPVGGYQGTLERGQPHGHGEYFMNDGGTYKGEFSHGRRSGKGVLTFAKGGVLTAQFDGEHVTGDVDYTWPDGQHYHGAWNGGPNGTGTMSYASGGSLTGDWNGPHPDGKYVIHYPNGKEREAEFKAATKSDDSGRYNMREAPEGRVSTERNEVARGLGVPADKPYGKLTPEQQAIVKSHYVILQDDDEPPYPLYGPRPFFKFISDAQSQMAITAEISIDVIVGADGKATGARILKSPLPDLSRFIVGELLKQKYKPAKCAGEPCEMVYPLRFKLVMS